MKRKYIIIVMLLVVTGLFTMQSCTKDTLVPIKAYVATVPANPTPALGHVMPFSAAPIVLKWEQGKGTTTSWDVLIVQPDFSRIKATTTTASYTFTPTQSGQYVWNVGTKDPNGITSTSVTLSGDSWDFFLNTPPAVPVLTAPKAGALNFSVTGALTWTATDTETPDNLTYDVYVGTTETPGAVASNLTAATYSPTLAATTLYYWKVVAKDPQGATTSSAVGSFTTGVEAIMTYTGNYLADEPAEAYSYDVTFAKASSTSVKTVNYWNSGWTGVFTIDIAKLTYIMPVTTFATGWTGTESGIVDPKTGTMTGAYTIWQNGKVAEQGIHTYTKQ